VAQLVQDGVLEVRPGQGTVVAQRSEPATRGERAAVLNGVMEELVVQALGIGLELDEVRAALEAQWRRLEAKR